MHENNTQVLYHALRSNASTVGKNYGQLSQLKIRAVLQSGMKVGKPTSQRTGVKPHNLTVKGNQAPAPVHCDTEVRYLT